MTGSLTDRKQQEHSAGEGKTHVWIWTQEEEAAQISLFTFQMLFHSKIMSRKCNFQVHNRGGGATKRQPERVVKTEHV